MTEVDPQHRPFHSVLVANRGEIALRIMRTARSSGYRIIAVYSEADAEAPHVAFADEAVLIGPAPVAGSYLDPAKILEAARTSGAEAIHPGYGFLSENAAFARACEEASLIFIGPSPGAIELMGDKARAKRHMKEAGIPCVPGYEGEDQSEAIFLQAAGDIGFPVMVKAAAGGGGKGMRLVHQESGLADALKMARSEAENAFGNGNLILEKAIIRPRHVEIQVFGDRHGNIIHLGERDCSVQRRHQKVIEEAPCPIMTPELRAQMGNAAVRAAKSVDYVGAGTVEFLLDESGSFYFLEMNTRLQVEHPVTELVTGLDLVALQIKVAAGQALELDQDEISIEGHAIEVRLYAEDPADDFLPASGRIDLWRAPAGAGVRVDEGIATGFEVSAFYDPMLAKVMAWGETREIARQRLITALVQTALFGPASNRDFLIAALQQEAFAAGTATTAFITEAFSSSPFEFARPIPEHYAAAAVLQFEAERNAARSKAIGTPEQLLNWTNAVPLVTPFDYSTAETPAVVSVSPSGGESYRVDVNGQMMDVLVERTEAPLARLSVHKESLGSMTHDVIFLVGDKGLVYLSIDGCCGRFIDSSSIYQGSDKDGGSGEIVSSMHGLLLDVLVAPGDQVRQDDTLAIVEAMKMQLEIKSDVNGTVSQIAGIAGEQIAAGELILEITPDEE